MQLRFGTDSEKSRITVAGAVNDGYTGSTVGETIFNTNSQLSFSALGSQALTITSARKIGIGITNPDTILHIKDSNPYATIQASSDGGECGVHFEDDDGNVDGKITYRTDYTGNTDNYMRFYTAATNALEINSCLLYTSPSPRDVEESRMPSSP